jgi:hypothetical protein
VSINKQRTKSFENIDNDLPPPTYDSLFQGQLPISISRNSSQVFTTGNHINLISNETNQNYTSKNRNDSIEMIELAVPK